MFLTTMKTGAALGISAMLITSICASAGASAPRDQARPGLRRDASTPATEQVLSEGGTLAANYYGNLMDIVGVPIACTTTTGEDRDCASESSLPTKAKTNPQYLYCATGTGGAQLDFVDQQSGKAGKTCSTVPEFKDNDDAYSNTSPIGFTTGWAGTASSSTTEDTLHFAAGDAPLPLGPSEGSGFVPSGFTVYADSFASYNGGGDTTGAGFNANRGPAKVAPLVGTGVRIAFNNTGLTYTAPLNLSQDDVCGIFTGYYTNWNQITDLATNNSGFSISGGSQPIQIIHRSDGSGTTFLTAYDLSEMCSFNNPFTGTGHPAATHYWGQTGHTQGVGTDSSDLSSDGAITADGSAPEVAWPSTSVGCAKSAGVIACLDGAGSPATGTAQSGAPAGYIGYVTPSDTLGANTDEAAVENYAGNFELVNSTTVTASLSGTSTSDANPAGYPEDNKSTILYFPFPTASAGAAIVGYTYGYFYTCYPARDKDQATAIKTLFEYETAKSTSATAATVAAFWNLSGMNATELKDLQSALSFKTAAVTKGTSYLSPVNGAKLDYTCTDT